MFCWSFLSNYLNAVNVVLIVRATIEKSHLKCQFKVDKIHHIYARFSSFALNFFTLKLFPSKSYDRHFENTEAGYVSRCNDDETSDDTYLELCWKGVLDMNGTDKTLSIFSISK